MAKTKPKHHPGIHLMKRVVFIEELGRHKSWYWWHIVSSNGRIIARSSETYTRKGNAVKSIKVVASIFELPDWHKYYDHSQPDSPLKSYL